MVSILIGNLNKKFCLPLQATVQDGVATIRKWADKHSKPESHVVQLIRQACLIASKLTYESVLLRDRYFLTVPVLKEWAVCEKQFQNQLVHIVTKAKKSAAAYYKPVQKGGRGASRKVGEKVKVLQLFTVCADKFTTAKALLYGEEKELQYILCCLLSFL